MGKKKIGFQGIKGCNSSVAAKKYTKSMDQVGFRTFKEIFKELEKNNLTLGILPVENSLTGGVIEVNKLLIKKDVKIVGELKLPITYALLSYEDRTIEEMDKVFSHPQALSQCSHFLSNHDLEVIPHFDTAGAAKMLAEEEKRKACAIARTECSDLFNLHQITNEIENNDENKTRFVIISKSGEQKGDKASVVFSVPHKPGSLQRILKVFEDHNINLTRIESVPITNQSWKYYFFLDFELKDERQQNFQLIVNILEKKVNYFNSLGCYYAHK